MFKIILSKYVVVLVSLLLTLSIFHTCHNVSIVKFEKVNVGWAGLRLS